MKGTFVWACVVALLVSANGSVVKRSSQSIQHVFAPGKEYVYMYEGAVGAGSNDYVSFSSAYNVTGELHVSNTGSELHVQLKEIKFGAYNGEFDMTNHPVYEMHEKPELNDLGKPFTVKLSKNGLATGIIFDGSAALWAQNMQRGIATALQMNLDHVHMGEHEYFTTEEDTVVGDCNTDYITVPHGDDVMEVRKFRKHSDCKNIVQRVKAPGVHVKYCPDTNSRDLLNSTGFGIYIMKKEGGGVTLTQVRAHSTVMYNLFGADGHTQYSYGGITLKLKEAHSGSVAAPSNGESHDDLHYEFASDMSEDEDLTKPAPFFFHHKEAKTDNQDVLITRLKENIKKMHDSLESIGVFKDTTEFHRVSPFVVVPIVSALDYDHLKKAHEEFKAGDETEYKLFLDALVVSGSGPAVLTIRDIAQETENVVWLARIIAPMPHYVRNPTEKLVQEIEPLVTKSGLPKHNERIIKFAFATLIHRACAKTGCTNTGIMDKWINKWFSDYESASHFEDKTVAIAALKNVDHEKSARKLITILANKAEEHSVRSAAFSSIRTLMHIDHKLALDTCLTIFFDKSEHTELRNEAAMYASMIAHNENVMNQLVIAMWSEKSAQVKNYVKTLLEGLAYSTRPCLVKQSSWAKTAVQWYPPWEVDGKYSGSYISDYYDREYNFGHLTHLMVQKTGKSILPSTLYLGLNGQLAGYGTNYFGAFLRIEGLGKSLTSRLMSMTTGVLDFDDIKEVFDKIGVVERQPEPLRIEIAVLLHNRVVAYHAADAKTVTTIPMLIKKLGELRTAAYDKELVRMMLLGGATVQQPNEYGTPVTVLSAATAVAAVHAKVSSQKSGSTLSRSYQYRFQLNFHGMSSLVNHMPAFGTAHSVKAIRTLRARVPREATIGLDIKQQTVNFVINVPTEEDPVIAQVHSTAYTAVENDSPATYRDTTAKDLLAESCPECKVAAVISKGEKFRESRKLGSGYKYKFMEGISAGAKYYDCEKIHSRIHVLRQLRKFFAPDNKNIHGRFGKKLTQIRLGMSYMIKSLFLSPPTETCGMKAYYKRDPTAKSVFDKVEGQIKLRHKMNPKNKPGMQVQVKSSVAFKYVGSQPKTNNVDLSVMLKKTSPEHMELAVKLAGKDGASGKGGVVCMEMEETKSKPTDYFDWEGVNEPEYERKTSIVWSKDTSGKDCPTNSAGIKIVKRASRSEAQKEEATKDIWPYKGCKEDKADKKHYPGSLAPATSDCVWSAFKQTNLRSVNYTINYRVDPEARQRWRYPGMVAAALLMPYWVPSESVDGHASHGDFGVDGDYIKGEIKMDLRLDEENPEADIHYHSSQGEQEHFHGVDLGFLPIKKPIFSRFSPLMYAAMKLGVYAYCDVTPSAVQTFDNLTYYADMSECPTLISADCSEKPRYAVLGQKISSDKLGLTIHMGEHKVEMKDMNTATVDGKSVPISDTLYTPDEDTQIFHIYKHDENNMFLISKSLSVVVRYTGHYATVTVGSRYRATNCGICGNFDGCPHNEFTGPDPTCKGMQANDMMKAYIVRESSCAGVGSACPV